MLQKFVISIRDATQRRQHITETFGKQKIPFTFFDAITPQEGLDDAISRYAPALASADNLTAGEKACFMSHVLLWQHCVDADLPYIAIFEDDVLLSPEAADFLNHDQWLNERLTPKHSFILRLITTPLPAVYAPCPALLPYKGRQFLTLIERQPDMGAYIISQAAARLLLADLQKLPAGHTEPIDLLLFGEYLQHDTLMLLQMCPTLFIQSSEYNQVFPSKKIKILNSQLDSERKAHQKARANMPPPPRPRKNWKEKIRHALTKIPREHEKYKKRIIEEYLRQQEQELDKKRKILPFQ